jgi:hypothetical protein
MTKILAAMLISISTTALAQEFIIDQKTKRRDFSEGVLIVSERGLFRITGTTYAGTNRGRNSSSTSALYIRGRQCAERTQGWVDGSVQYSYSCIVRLNAGSYPISAQELTNSNATGQGINISVTALRDKDGDIEVIG